MRSPIFYSHCTRHGIICILRTFHIRLFEIFLSQSRVNTYVNMKISVFVLHFSDGSANNSRKFPFLLIQRRDVSLGEFPHEIILHHVNICSHDFHMNSLSNLKELSFCHELNFLFYCPRWDVFIVFLKGETFSAMHTHSSSVSTSRRFNLHANHR